MSRGTRGAARGSRPLGRIRGQIGHTSTMALEAHATAAGAGHPPAGGDPPPGALVNLAETVVIKEENVFAVSARDGSARRRAASVRRLRGRLPLRLRPRAARQRRAAATARDLGGPGSESVHELTNPALPLRDDRVLPLQSLQIRLERCLRREPGSRRRWSCAPTTGSRSTSTSSWRSRRTSSRCWPSAASSRRCGGGRPDRAARPRRPLRDPRTRRAVSHDDGHRRPALRARRVAGTLRFPLSLAPGGGRDDPLTLRAVRASSRRAGRATAPARPRRVAAGGPTSGSRGARWCGPTTSSSTGCCAVRCSTSACCIRGWATTAITRRACPGTRRCSGATP